MRSQYSHLVLRATRFASAVIKDNLRVSVLQATGRLDGCGMHDDGWQDR